MKKLFLLSFLVCAVAHSYAANRYWVAAASANWADASSWSTTSGGTSGASAPTTGDDVFFTSGTTVTVTLGAAVDVNSITFTSRNVTFAGAYAITTNSLTLSSSQITTVDNLIINSALTFQGTNPRITNNTSTNGKSITLGNGGAFTLTGNSTTSYFTGTSKAYYTYNTTTPLTVYFNPTTTTAGGIVVTKGLITLGNNISTLRLNLSATNSQELIIGVNTTLTLSATTGTSNFSLLTNSAGGAVNASAAGSKFIIKSTNASVLTTAKRIFKENSTINQLQFNASGDTLTLAQPIRVRTLTVTAGTVGNATNSITLAPGGSYTGTVSPNAVITGTALTRYWVGGTTGDWSLATNWGVSSGSATTRGIPEFGDNVEFDNSTGNANPTVTLTEPVIAPDITFTNSNVTFAGAFGITSNSMTANSSQATFVDAVLVNSALTFSGTNSTITHNAATSGKSFTFGNAGAFTLTGNSETNYFTGNSNGFYTFNTSSPLTVYFNPSIISVGSIIVTKGSITLGNSVNTIRLHLSALNNERLILGENTTLSIYGNGGSNFTSTASGGVIDASAAGSKFVVKSVHASVLATTGRIFKAATTIEHLEMNSDTKTFVPAYPLTVKNLTLTAGSIDNTTNNITIPSGGNLVVTAGTTTAALNASLASAPSSVVATAGDGQASVAFTAPVNGGSLITNYKYSTDGTNFVACSPAKTTSPIVITGLTNTNPYTLKLKAVNSIGDGAEGVASSSVTPDATLNDITVSTAKSASELALTPVSDVVVSKDALLTIDQSTPINSLTVAAGGQVTNASTLITPTVTINSTELDGTGTFIDNGTSTITNAVVNQYLGTTRNWYVSSPVVSTASSTSNIEKYFEYIEAGNNNDLTGQPAGSSAFWKGYTPGATFMEAGKGYIAMPSNTSASLQFNGTFNPENVSIPLTKAGNGFNLIGNPYPSHLTWTQAFVNAVTAPIGGTAPATLIYPTIWIRTKTGNSNAGGWLFNTHNALSGETVPSWADVVIAPMQAFWVKAKVTGTLILTSDLTKSHSTTNRLKAPATKNTNRQRVRLQVSNGTTTDEALIYFDAAASNSFDDYDSPKYAELSTVTQIYSKVGNEKLVINGMNALPLNQEIGLGFVPGNASSFSIKANEISNLPADVKVILRDNVKFTETDLTNGITAYQFSPEETAGNRFSILFRTSGTTTGTTNVNNEPVSVFVNTQNEIIINATTGSKYTIYNAVGQQIAYGTMRTKLQTINCKLQTGLVVVKVNNQSTRVIVK